MGVVGVGFGHLCPRPWRCNAVWLFLSRFRFGGEFETGVQPTRTISSILKPGRRQLFELEACRGSHSSATFIAAILSGRRLGILSLKPFVRLLDSISPSS